MSAIRTDQRPGRGRAERVCSGRRDGQNSRAVAVERPRVRAPRQMGEAFAVDVGTVERFLAKLRSSAMPCVQWRDAL
jgi:hypothetical protein